MEPLALIVPLILAAALLFGMALFVQRAGVALAETRARAGFQRDAAELATRIDATLAPLVARVDTVRRGNVPATEIHEDLRNALDELATYLEEARAIKTPQEFAETRSMIAQDIQRGARSVEMVLHGVRLAGGSGGRQTELEAQTSIKRGYLNLLHARDAVTEHLTDLAEAREAGTSKWRTSRV